jgi:hypothetical protein
LPAALKAEGYREELKEELKEELEQELNEEIVRLAPRGQALHVDSRLAKVEEAPWGTLEEAWNSSPDTGRHNKHHINPTTLLQMVHLMIRHHHSELTSRWTKYSLWRVHYLHSKVE